MDAAHLQVLLGGAEEGVSPTFIVDVSTEYERKQDLLKLYASQWQVDMDWLSNSSHWGSLIGARSGEAFVSAGPVGIDNLMMFKERLGFPREPGK